MCILLSLDGVVYTSVTPSWLVVVEVSYVLTDFLPAGSFHC